METSDKPFHQLHSQSGFIYIDRTQTTLYADGASMQGHGFDSVMYTPIQPEDKAKRIAFFWETKVEQLVEAFDLMKNNLKMSATAVARDGSRTNLAPEPLAELRRIKAEIGKARKEQEKAEQAVEDLTPKQVKERRAELDRRRAMGVKYLEELEAIKL